MKVLHLDMDSKNEFPDGCVLTQGTFDGIHLGHARLLESVIERGRELRLPSVLLTFKPHPAKVLRPSRRIPLLTLGEERIPILEKFGLDYVALFEFNTELAILQPEDYVRRILVGKFGIKAIVVGYNHTFGRKREGNGAFLEKVKNEYGFEVTIQQPVMFENEPVHSSRVRSDMFDGNFGSAVTMLDRPYRISGTVVRGRGVGRQLGYPTINVRAHKDKLIPKFGVYAARVRINGDWFPGMMYISEDRSIFDLEVSIFDFQGDLYDRYVDVDVVARTRDGIRFDSNEELAAQIATDEQEIRGILSGK